MTGIYHIMVRGINKEQIFNRPIYKNKILQFIEEIREELEFHVIAYCVMNNHMHLLLKADDDKLEIIMKKLNVKYAMYYNKVEDRYGHVFQDRFKSEIVEDESYLLGALRYIHNNPVKAGMIKNFEQYYWSSGKDYFIQDSNIITFKCLNDIINLFKNKDEFLKFHKNDDDNLYIDTIEEENEHKLNYINKEIENFAKEMGIIENKQLKNEFKEDLAERLLKMNLITIREVAGLCNLSKYRVSELDKKIRKN
jgi:REP element-mobilizing transposase RayT